MACHYNGLSYKTACKQNTIKKFAKPLLTYPNFIKLIQIAQQMSLRLLVLSPKAAKHKLSLTELLLSFEPLLGKYSGPNLIKVLIIVLQKHQLADRVLTVTTDNSNKKDYTICINQRKREITYILKKNSNLTNKRFFQFRILEYAGTQHFLCFAEQNSILSYWKDYKQEYPLLIYLVKDFLAASVTSVGVKRLFNLAYNIYYYQRSLLSPTIIQDLMMLNYTSEFETKTQKIEVEREERRVQGEKDKLEPISDNKEEDIGQNKRALVVASKPSFEY
ncbi:hypothetical protein N7481_005161 [Penicillium waksmanii]|uniref:uncharacterized protein n=1 Tax=Penicillium waksmanii TaxID=69791 RepID=UPI00254917C1|nr:uncharacterized protein N7481_005161 [Penicillium waksmanii]KAJ5983062.1 hypothetical protein N7481_005161 [Penicillium waksmanii]